MTPVLDRPPPRPTDWIRRPSLLHGAALPGSWQVSKSGRYVAPQLPCPYLADEAAGKPRRRRQRPSSGAGQGASSTSSVRSLPRSRSVPPQAAATQARLAAACKAYAAARPSHHALAKSASARAARERHEAESLAAYALELCQAHELRLLWARLSAAAEEMGVDVATYAQLWELQHREIGPEDYSALQALQAGVKPRTLREADLHAFATARVGPSGQLVGAEPLRLPAGAGAAGFCAGGVCVVCMEAFAPGETVRVLPCRHFFHKKCIYSWLTSASTTCPIDGIEVLVGPPREGEAEAREEEDAGEAGAEGRQAEDDS